MNRWNAINKTQPNDMKAHQRKLNTASAIIILLVHIALLHACHHRIPP